jgi:hypothetical protein
VLARFSTVAGEMGAAAPAADVTASLPRVAVA